MGTYLRVPVKYRYTYLIRIRLYFGVFRLHSKRPNTQKGVSGAQKLQLGRMAHGNEASGADTTHISAWCMCLAAQSVLLWLLCGRKPTFLAQNQVETFSINTSFLIHNFSFKSVQEEGKHCEFSGRSFSLLTSSFF